MEAKIARIKRGNLVLLFTNKMYWGIAPNIL